jgi:copper chaperone CopZ
MTCGGCENAVKRAVGKLAGVSAVEASHKDGRVTVTFDEGLADMEAVKAKIEGLGYRVAQG